MKNWDYRLAFVLFCLALLLTLLAKLADAETRKYTNADLNRPLPPKAAPPSKETMEGLKARQYVAPIPYDGPIEAIAPYTVPPRPAYLRPPPTRPTVVFINQPYTYRRRR